MPGETAQAQEGLTQRTQRAVEADAEDAKDAENFRGSARQMLWGV